MSEKQIRIEALIGGVVQGVGFRYFVMKNAQRLNLAGYVKNLPSGKVQTVAEGPEWAVEELVKKLRMGPSSASVSELNVERRDPKGNFQSFNVEY